MSEQDPKEFLPDVFATKLRVAIARRGIHLRKAAEEIGVSHATISRVSRGTAPDVFSYFRIQYWLIQEEREVP